MTKELPSAFDPNEGNLDGAAQWPVIDNAFSAAEYADVFLKGAGVAGGPGTLKAFLDDTAVAMKASVPPEMATFAHMQIVPDPNGRNIIPVPGIPPQVIQKIMIDHLGPKMIVNMRVADVMRYSDYSAHVWKPGWSITLREGFDYPDADTKKEKQEARDFLTNCNSLTTDARQRDAMHLTNFKTFLSSVVRDSLTYDGIAIWTDNDLKGRTKKFRALSAYNVRLCTINGYQNDPNIFAVGVDEGNNVKEHFTRHSLIWHVRNPRADARVGGYGYPEIDQALRLVQAFSDCFDMNAATFTRNSIPNGLLKVKGMWNQRQLDVLSRIWQNLKRGVSKSWALPVLPVPKDGEIELLDLSAARGEDAKYEDFTNMLIGALCVLWCFPVDRLGYHTSGRGPDSKVDQGKGSAARVDIADPGLMPLLTIIETVINEYLVWPRWPHLSFGFQGKSPIEDARQFELRTLAMLSDERRALVDLPKMEDTVEGDELKEIARIAGACPIDPALQGTYQALASAYFSAKFGAKAGEESAAGSPFSSKKDPAESERHGHLSGTRRDSKMEAESAEAG